MSSSPNSTLRRRKPRKSTRSKDITESDTSDSAPKSNIADVTNNLQKNLTARDRLHAHLAQLKKDRSKGSYACEDNANHEY